MTKSNFEKLAKAPAFARPPLPDEGASPIAGYGARYALLTGGRRAARAVRCNLQRWCRLSSSSGSRSKLRNAARRRPRCSTT